MRISEFIDRLEVLKELAGDVEVCIEDAAGHFEVAVVYCQNVVLVPGMDAFTWASATKKNTNQIIAIG